MIFHFTFRHKFKAATALFCSVGVWPTILNAYATVRDPEVRCDTIEVISVQLAMGEAQEYCHYAASERKKVEVFWGMTWTEVIQIHVDDAYKISRGLQTERGFIEMPIGRVREQRSALLHEIVHVYAPNTNRFLAEGLAVYLQATLGGNPAFPNFGKGLSALARHNMSAVTSLESLNNVKTPRPLRSVMQEQSAYIIAGSFVGFLIEKYGIVMFRHLYDTGSYDTAYGKSLTSLESQWRAEVGNRSERSRFGHDNRALY